MLLFTAWPGGTYAFPKSTSGCPSGFTTGCRFHDSEDTRNKNYFINADDCLDGYFDADIEMCYCVKTSSSGSSWPSGQYCINRYGGSCPSGFSAGQIVWDDEDDSPDNDIFGTLPDGSYNSDLTTMEYCCRNDGTLTTAITLPADEFVLYQYLNQGCQSVSGLTATEVVVKFDTQDTWNDDSCSGGPYDPPCAEDTANHEIYMCHYKASL